MLFLFCAFISIHFDFGRFDFRLSFWFYISTGDTVWMISFCSYLAPFQARVVLCLSFSHLQVQLIPPSLRFNYRLFMMDYAYDFDYLLTYMTCASFVFNYYLNQEV